MVRNHLRTIFFWRKRIPPAEPVVPKSFSYTIYADDGIYHMGKDYQYEDLTFKVAELPLEVEAEIQGFTYDEVGKSYVAKDTDAAPEYAFGYAARQLDGQYRMFQHYAVRLMKIKVEHKPKPDGSDIQSYELTFRNTHRKADGAFRWVGVSTDNTYALLDIIENLPTAPPEGGGGE
jgi:phi13 family phage major tail protein